jgi:hypothetical protein
MLQLFSVEAYHNFLSVAVSLLVDVQPFSTLISL